MFKLFRKDPLKKLEAEYARLLQEARDLQRNGDIQGFAVMTARAEELGRQIEASKAGEQRAP